MDSQTFERLVEEHKDSVYRQMVRVCEHREDAEDALATALMLAFRSLAQLESETAFRSWIGIIAKRVCTRMRSHPSLQSVWEYANDHSLISLETPDMDLEILKGCVKEAVEDLPEIYRDVYVACEIEERTVPETAAYLGLTEAATKSRLLRAREAVRKRLDQSICGT